MFHAGLIYLLNILNDRMPNALETHLCAMIQIPTWTTVALVDNQDGAARKKLLMGAADD